MIQPLLVIFLILPIILGILSVDVEGNRFSIRDFIKGNFMTEPLRAGFEGYLGKIPESNATEVVNLVELPENGSMNNLQSIITDGIVFLFLQSREFGIWLGIATAPFHYLLAVVIGFSFLFPSVWLFIVGFFYISISERKEIRKEFHDMRVGAKMK